MSWEKWSCEEIKKWCGGPKGKESLHPNLFLKKLCLYFLKVCLPFISVPKTMWDGGKIYNIHILKANTLMNSKLQGFRFPPHNFVHRLFRPSMFPQSFLPKPKSPPPLLFRCYSKFYGLFLSSFPTLWYWRFQPIFIQDFRVVLM